MIGDMKHNPVLANQLKSKWEHHRRMADVYEAAWKAEVSEISGNGDQRKKKGEAQNAPKTIPNLSKDAEKSLAVNPSRDWLRKLLREHPGLGPSEIRRRADSENRTYNDSFPYTSLWKLKSKGELTEKDGKYFLKE